jgi:hypothetical protein
MNEIASWVFTGNQWVILAGPAGCGMLTASAVTSALALRGSGYLPATARDTGTTRFPDASTRH